MRTIAWNVMLLMLLCPAGTTPAADASAVPEWERTSLYVAVRDGTRLAMNIYRPARHGTVIDDPLPVIFSFTPYRSRYRNAGGEVVELSQARRFGLEPQLAHGYVIAEADIRGKGASYGSRRGFQDRTEAQDGYDLVQWLAGQPFSSGAVGMVGCSYLGGTTVQVATTHPPALKAIFTGATDFDKYEFVRRGGITAQFNTRPDEPLSDDLMSLPVDADADGAMLREAVAQHAGNTPMAELWYGMPFRDSVSPLTGNRYWEEVGPYTYLEDLRRSGIAMYFWGNWQDEPTSQVLLAAANLGGKLLVGPGSHCVPPPGYDLGGEILRFFDHHLKGVDNGIEREPQYTWWIENTVKGGEWVHGDQLPGSASTPASWYIDAAAGAAADTINDGTLRQDAPEQSRQSFQVDYDLDNREYFAFWVAPQDGHGLTYTSTPLNRDLLLEGYPVAHLRLGADSEDVNVFAYLEEVGADDQVTVLGFGRLAAGYRATGTAPYDNLGLPWHTARAADYQPLVPAQEVELDFALSPVARRIPAGKRLRLTITGADPRQRNLEQVRRDPPQKVTLRLGGGNGSRIDLPVIRP